MQRPATQRALCSWKSEYSVQKESHTPKHKYNRCKSSRTDSVYTAVQGRRADIVCVVGSVYICNADRNPQFTEMRTGRLSSFTSLFLVLNVWPLSLGLYRPGASFFKTTSVMLEWAEVKRERKGGRLIWDAVLSYIQTAFSSCWKRHKGRNKLVMTSHRVKETGNVRKTVRMTNRYKCIQALSVNRCYFLKWHFSELFITS